MVKTVIVIGPKKTIEVEPCINILGNPAYSLTIDGVKSIISEGGYKPLIERAKETGFAVFEEM